MVVLVFLLSVRELTGYARSPDDNGLLAFVIPKEFWCPHIDGRGISHHLDETLITPMLQVLGTSIAKAAVTTPGTGPNEVERAIGGTDDAWITHDTLFAHLRLQPRAGNGVPVPAIIAVDEPQTVGCRLMEGGGHIYFTLG